MLELILLLFSLLTPHSQRVMTVWEEAERAGVEPELMVRLSERENYGGIANAWSPTGCCVGVMQVNVRVHLQEHWAKCMDREGPAWEWRVRARVEDLYDVRVNACYGVEIFKTKLEWCEGRVKCALWLYGGWELGRYERGVGYVNDIMEGTI